MGLIERDYEADAPAPTPLTQWQKLEQFVDGLNNGAPKSVQYKVLFLGRHGEGVHNVAERQYGRKSWDVSFVKRPEVLKIMLMKLKGLLGKAGG